MISSAAVEPKLEAAVVAFAATAEGLTSAGEGGGGAE